MAGIERVETPVQTLGFLAPGETYQRQEKEDWEKEIRLAGTSSPQLRGIAWGIGWDALRCLPATQETSKFWAPRKLAIPGEVDQGDGWLAGVSPIPKL